jgi:hypothetical protein
VTVIFEPAAAIAAGICLTARTIADNARTDRHPRPCGWCDWDLSALRQMVNGFEVWTDRDARGVPRRFEVVQFQSLPQREQAELVLEAQAFPPLEQPTTAAIAVPAHDVDEEGPAWLRA